MKKSFQVILLLFLPLLIKSQTTPEFLIGKALTPDSIAIEGMMITMSGQPEKITFTDVNGHFKLNISGRSRFKLSTRLLGYKSTLLTINTFNLPQEKDTTFIVIRVEKEGFIMPEAVIEARKVDTIASSRKFFIEDFEFSGNDRFILLTWEKSLDKAKVMLSDYHGNILSAVDVPKPVKELFTDYRGETNVICEGTVYYVDVNDDHVSLLRMDKKEFDLSIRPCVDSFAGRIIFTNYFRNYPSFSYFTYDASDTSVQKICSITDADLMEMYNFEYYFLPPRARLEARKMEQSSGVDKHIIAAHMRGLPNSIFYTPLYAPLFVVNDTVVIFDHYKNKLYRYSSKLKLCDSLPITHHQPRNWKEWERQLFFDRTKKEVYALHKRGHYQILKKVDTRTGKIISEYKLENPHVTKMKIRDGSVYYIYRPFESMQKKFLYREKLPD